MVEARSGLVSVIYITFGSCTLSINLLSYLKDLSQFCKPGRQPSPAHSV